jgi:VIT1/CCC1 family predicted Fe2+/Mn2+ transporter
MKQSIKKGVGFGLTSGIITTLGLMIGLYSSTNSRLVILSGILLIAIADALSDAFGIHVSEEFEGRHSLKGIWESTASTFLSKFVFAISFVVPIFLFQLRTAMIVSIGWGLLLISVLSFYMSKKSKHPFKTVLEHLVLTISVIIVTYYLGLLIKSLVA